MKTGGYEKNPVTGIKKPVTGTQVTPKVIGDQYDFCSNNSLKKVCFDYTRNDIGKRDLRHWPKDKKI